jgi:hypothetical protein
MTEPVATRPQGLAASLLLSALLPTGAWAQMMSTQHLAQAQSAVGAQVDALTILGGDFGFSAGSFHQMTPFGPGPPGSTHIQVSKFGGDGDIGDPVPLGDTGLGWQPRLQGNMGFLTSTNHPSDPLAGDTNKFKGESIEFGGGARFWINDRLSFAPTLMALYGHSTDTYTAVSPLGVANLATLKQEGLVDWTINTISLRPALNVEYLLLVDRARVTLSTDIVAFVTRSLSSSTLDIDATGNSGYVTTKIDVDIPLGIALDGHELRTGGYLSHTDLIGLLRDGLGTPHLSEIHARLVADFLGQVWRVQWLGIGASYVWGPNIQGWTWGADVTFKF